MSVRALFGIVVAAFLCVPVAFAQKTAVVETTYEYIAPANMTLEQAKLVAVERAKIQAIADEFGTIVQDISTTAVSNSGGASAVDFLKVSSSDVRGEWIKTMGEPAYDIRYWQGQLVVKVNVKGKIREVEYLRPEFEVRLLRNCTDDNCEAEEFKDKDRLYMSFRAAEDGFMSAFVVVNDSVHCLLPSCDDAATSVSIEGRKRHLFLDDADTETEIVCSAPMEINAFYTLFSPKEITSPLVEDEVSASSGFDVLSLERFNKWLAKLRSYDKRLQIVKKYITIKQ